MGTNQQNRERASRAAFYEGEFSIDDLEFRPFTAATKLHLETLDIGETLPAEDDDDGWADMIIAMAWCQWAPVEDINDLCFSIDEADDDAERAALLKQYRRQLLSFKSRLTGPIMVELAKRMTSILSNQQDLSYATEEKPDAPESETSPPGN